LPACAPRASSNIGNKRYQAFDKNRPRFARPILFMLNFRHGS
jgi:hypothetical protein